MKAFLYKTLTINKLKNNLPFICKYQGNCVFLYFKTKGAPIIMLGENFGRYLKLNIYIDIEYKNSKFASTIY